MSEERIRFQFTIASLFRATLYAAIAVLMLTIPGDYLSAKVAFAFCFGGAAIGTLFEHGGYGAAGGYLVFLIGAMLG